MKKSVFLAVCSILLLPALQAQTKATYLENVVFEFPGSGTYNKKENSTNHYACELEKNLVNFRVIVLVKGVERGILGKNGAALTCVYTPHLRNDDLFDLSPRSVPVFTKQNEAKIYIGEFAPDDQFDIRFVLWKDIDKSGGAWKFSDSDMMYEHLVTLAAPGPGFLNYVERTPECMGVNYKITQQ